MKWIRKYESYEVCLALKRSESKELGNSRETIGVGSNEASRRLC